jgi:hypothetical protein
VGHSADDPALPNDPVLAASQERRNGLLARAEERKKPRSENRDDKMSTKTLVPTNRVTRQGEFSHLRRSFTLDRFFVNYSYRGSSNISATFSQGKSSIIIFDK